MGGFLYIAVAHHNIERDDHTAVYFHIQRNCTRNMKHHGANYWINLT